MQLIQGTMKTLVFQNLTEKEKNHTNTNNNNNNEGGNAEGYLSACSPWSRDRTYCS